LNGVKLDAVTSPSGESGSKRVTPSFLNAAIANALYPAPPVPLI